MFSIVVEFKRDTTENKFFYEEFTDHPVIVKILSLLQQHPKYISMYRESDDYTFKILLKFKDKGSFLEILNNNQELFITRHMMIEEWCEKVDHKYSFYEINE
jgi:hypothetical protein